LDPEVEGEPTQSKGSPLKCRKAQKLAENTRGKRIREVEKGEGAKRENGIPPLKGARRIPE